MAIYSTNEFKAGLKVMLDGDPCSIIENEYVKPGKGQGFNRVRLRNLLNGRVWERTFKGGETIEGADVSESSMEYLYSDGEFWHFMKTDGSFEQIAADKTAVADALNWLKEQEQYIVMLWNDAPISVTPPNFVELEVTETDPGLRGDTATGGTKPAKLISGATVRVPLFVDRGDVLRIDTRTGDYVSRAKKYATRASNEHAHPALATDCKPRAAHSACGTERRHSHLLCRARRTRSRDAAAVPP